MLKAVVYDFDGTLTSKPMPEFKILEMSGLEGGVDNPKFFEMAHEIARQKEVNIYEAMIWTILRTVRDAGFRLTDENISAGANERTYNPGVKNFLTHLQNRGIKNYLLSSGAKAYLEQLKIAPCFEQIYASILSYDENGEANDIAHVMTDSEKSVALQEIAQQVNGTSDDFSGIIYVGDGPTDVVAMDYIKRHGGGAILIQHDSVDENWPQVDASGIDLATTPDFTEGSELATYIEGLIESQQNDGGFPPFFVGYRLFIEIALGHFLLTEVRIFSYLVRQHTRLNSPLRRRRGGMGR